MTDPAPPPAPPSGAPEAAPTIPPGAFPAAAALPPKPACGVWGERLQWLGIAGLFALGLWLAYYDFTEAGLAILLLALERLGNAMKLTGDQRRTLAMVARSVVVGVATAHGVRQVKSDVEDIRNNPAMPGTPTAGTGPDPEGGHEAAG